MAVGVYKTISRIVLSSHKFLKGVDENPPLKNFSLLLDMS